MSALTACLAGACDAENEVQRQTRELQAAQKDVGKETKRLEEELGRAQADVARLDQKLSLARQGLTDEVLENQKQLEEALKAQDEKVRDELNHAQREAQNHTRQTEAALKQLGQTPPPASSGAPPPTRDELRREELLAVRGGPELGEGEADAGDDAPQEPASAPAPASPPAK
jgi:chromosome segregation ATPase